MKILSRTYASATFRTIAFVTLMTVGAVSPAQAGPTVQLQAGVSSELPNDLMVVQLAVERSGPASEKLNEDVLNVLDLTLAKAKAVDGVKARLGSITTQPQWNDQGKRTGWQVRGVVVLEGSDLKATGKLAGELSSNLQIAGVSFRLTEAARTREEGKLLKEAAAAFNQRAKEAAAAFGFSGFALKTLNINHAAPNPPRPIQMEMRAASMASSPSIPVDGGEATVTLTINGSVELE